MTNAQIVALQAASESGAVCAGYNTRRNGSRFYVAYPTLRALHRRGLLALVISPDGGVMGRITDAGRAAR